MYTDERFNETIRRFQLLMEKIPVNNSSKDEVLPSLIKAIAANEVTGFDGADDVEGRPSSSSVFVSWSGFSFNRFRLSYEYI